jgi:hypothetical protein
MVSCPELMLFAWSRAGQALTAWAPLAAAMSAKAMSAMITRRKISCIECIMRLDGIAISASLSRHRSSRAMRRLCRASRKDARLGGGDEASHALAIHPKHREVVLELDVFDEGEPAIIQY